MRWWPLVVFVACAAPPPPKQRVFPTLERSDTYHTRIAKLRTTLGRAGITLRVAGQDDTFSTVDCDSTKPGVVGGCARCVLAGHVPEMDGAVIDAVTEAFKRYPTDVLVASKITNVALCREIDYAKEQQLEHFAGLADVEGHGLLLSLKHFLDQAVYRSGADFTVADIAHHEVFHLIEYALMNKEVWSDSEWNLHNPLGFAYAESNNTEPRRAGFVNSYAMTNPVEDKASVYEFMMAHPDDLCAMAKTDEILRIKSRIVWRRLRVALGTDSFIRAAAPCIDWLDT